MEENIDTLEYCIIMFCDAVSILKKTIHFLIVHFILFLLIWQIFFSHVAQKVLLFVYWVVTPGLFRGAYLIARLWPIHSLTANCAQLQTLGYRGEHLNMMIMRLDQKI